MKTYKVKYKVELKQTIDGEEILQAESAEAAEKEVTNKFLGRDGKGFIVSIFAEELEYRTEKWRDVEDVIKELEQDVQSAKADNEDEDMISMYKSDRDDWKGILENLIHKNFEEAARMYSDMDTASREHVPDRIYNLFEALELI